MPYELRVYRHANRAWAVPRLVETLEQARTEALFHIVNSHEGGDGDADDWEECEIRAQRIPRSGGKVGPLPDGYIVEVRPRFTPRRRSA